MRAVSIAAVFGCALLSAAGVVDTNEYRTVIHPGAADGSGFWNRRAQWFMYAPAFAFEADAPLAFFPPTYDGRACRVRTDAFRPGGGRTAPAAFTPTGSTA